MLGLGAISDAAISDEGLLFFFIGNPNVFVAGRRGYIFKAPSRDYIFKAGTRSYRLKSYRVRK